MVVAKDVRTGKGLNEWASAYVHTCIHTYINVCVYGVVTAMLRQMSSRSATCGDLEGHAFAFSSQRNNPRDSSSCVSSVGFNSTASTPGALALPHLGPINTPDSTEISMSPPRDLKTEAALRSKSPPCRRPSRLTDSERGRRQGSTGQAFLPTAARMGRRRRRCKTETLVGPELPSSCVG